jgi:predicted nuclease with TOPRIM domain
MKQNIIMAAALTVAALFIFSACAGGQYDDAVAINKKFVGAVEDYVSEMDSADNADAVADALNNFAAEVEKLAPEMKKIADKYPELEDPAQIPEELKESQAEAEAVSMKMAGHMMKAFNYMGDEDVKAAQMRLQKAMAGLGE